MSTGTLPQMQLLTKEFIFKSDHTGKSKKSGQDFRVIELHDPVTLDNTRFFIRDGQNVSTSGINFGMKVIAAFGMDIVYGRTELVLQSIRKA